MHWLEHGGGYESGKVKLLGTADSKAAKDLASRLAMNTRGGARKAASLH